MSLSAEVNIVTLKRGERYPALYANRLYHAARLHRRTLPAPWIAEHWHDALESETAQ